MNRDWMKHRNMYFLAVPAVLGLWVLYLGLVSNPAAAKRQTDFEAEYKISQAALLNIIRLDPERLSKKDKKEPGSDFDYSTAIDRLAREFSIAANQYEISSKKAAPKEGKMVQTADIKIKNIDMVKLTGFLSRMLTLWPDLECTELTLTRVKGAKDSWETSFKLTYYF